MLFFIMIRQPGQGEISFLTKPNEVVLRDQTGIWASYTQGPDAATVVDPATKNTMILGFFTPETSRETMRLGMQEAVDLLWRATKGETENPVILP